MIRNAPILSQPPFFCFFSILLSLLLPVLVISLSDIFSQFSKALLTHILNFQLMGFFF